MEEIPRLSNHFEPEKGWMNDPNGLCFFQGRTHAFFQHNPFEPKWGPMHWGHAVSDDLVSWEELPIALFPDMPYENGGGCFSGSALEKDGLLYLMYTSVSKERGQTQSMAVSQDGLHFKKLAENPVIPQSPLDSENRDFRDPKLFRYGDGFRMVCGAGVNGLASVLLFSSPDLLHWDYIGPLFQCRDYGPVPECPDLFPLGDKWVLMFSRMDETRSAQFVVGSFDGEHFTPESFQQPERGSDFYAPQTFLDGKGRRIMIGWLFNWNRKVPENAVRAGALSIPRQLFLRDNAVCNFPVEEAWGLLEDGDESVLDEIAPSLKSDVSPTEIKVLKDHHAQEVFINGGQYSFSFYTDCR